ncbi:CynX/NimT family MFS transporter [Streptomyces sp. NPDC059009]|uniref:CynX/NimT family MFS transporter n=1 Tax=Streptomyces sp. NPDC059009 TaxID=3346694 RepID=UPI0036CE12F3
MQTVTCEIRQEARIGRGQETRTGKDTRIGKDRGLFVLAVGVLLIGANLRPGVVAVSPELAAIRAGTGLSASAAGLLTTLPILCFGLLAPLAARLARRIGRERALGTMMALLTAGIAIRLLPGLVTLFAGTIVLSAALALSNVLVPSVIKHHFDHRVGLMMGLYSVALFSGAALAAGVTLPLGDALGLGWRGAVGLWALFSALAFVLWLPQMRRAPAAEAPAAPVAVSPQTLDEVDTADADDNPADRRKLRHSRLAWQVTLFMGLQSLVYYACVAWIPGVLTSHGMGESKAGFLLSLMNLVGITGSLTFTALVRRTRNQVPFAVCGSLLFGCSLVGLALAPVGGAYLWMLLQGLGGGLLISTALAVIVLRSPDSTRAAEMSGMAQGFGYLLAAAGPFLVGVLHDATGQWTLPLLLLAALCVPMTLLGIGAGRNRRLDDPASAASTATAR